MGGFMSALGTVAGGFGNALMDEARQNSPLANALYNRYRSTNTSPQATPAGMGPPPTSAPPPGALDIPNQNPGLANQWQSGPSTPGQSSLWNKILQTQKPGQPPNSPSGSFGSTPSYDNQLGQPEMPENLAGGKLVTQPTLARVGEKGPEMVVPLTSRPQNRIQPDLLEGHITAPKVPGVRYSSYRHFTNRVL